VTEIFDFGLILLAVSGGVSLALLAIRLTSRFPIPAPALFLLGAALVSDFFPGLQDNLAIRTVERIAVVALIVILFNGGMHIGWRRFRGAAAPIVLLGTAGTFATAALMTLAAKLLLDVDWITAGLIGAALSPTDPAVTFSVLGNRQVVGRTGTILEGESGMNDPVGIALMIGLIELAEQGNASAWLVAEEFLVQMAVGLVVGVIGGALLVPVMRKLSLPSEGLYPLRTLAAAGLVYGVASVADGSGFLAVFVAGILVGDARAPFKAEVERFHGALASLAEIAVFVALGLTLDLSEVLTSSVLWEGIGLAIVLAFVARPLALAPLLMRARLRRGERLFLFWGGLKGAVPIMLGSLAVLSNVDDARRIYELIFVVVAFSVLIQGSTIPLAARRLGVRMRTREPEPWRLSIGLPKEPGDLHRHVVRENSYAAGKRIKELPLGEYGWIVTIVREGSVVRPGGSSVLEPGDEVVVSAESTDARGVRRLFEGGPQAPMSEPRNSSSAP
jgi:cell volume regulation protein A